MAHFYAWFPGDHQRDTVHLNFVEDAALRRLLDGYYMLNTLAANNEVLLRVARAVSPAEQSAVVKIAREFFEVREGRLFHKKVEHEIARSRMVSTVRSEAGKKGAAARQSKSQQRKPDSSENSTGLTDRPASKPAANGEQPTPSVDTEGKPSVTAAPSSAPLGHKKVLFDLGVSILTKTGTPESSARTFLAKYAKQNEGKLAEVLGHLAAHPKIEPKAYIAGAFKPEARGLVI